MSEQSIPYIADSKNLLPIALHNLWIKSGIRLMPYERIDPENLPMGCLLFAPYWHNGKYLSVEALWKKYFAQCVPDLKLVIIGTNSGHVQNYFDAVDLPKDPYKLFSNALPVNAKWVPVASGGLDVEHKLKRFIDGHSATFDPDQSVLESFGKMRKSMVLNLEELSEGVEPDEILEKTFTGMPANQFHQFLTRWNTYRPYFETLPFATVFKEIEEVAVQLKIQFNDRPSTNELVTWFKKSLILINTIHQQLLIVEAYVRDYKTL